MQCSVFCMSVDRYQFCLQKFLAFWNFAVEKNAGIVDSSKENVRCRTFDC